MMNHKQIKEVLEAAGFQMPLDETQVVTFILGTGREVTGNGVNLGQAQKGGYLYLDEIVDGKGTNRIIVLDITQLAGVIVNTPTG